MAQQSAEHKEVIHLLKSHGAVLVRTKKHQIWKMPDGRSYTMPSSPSCPFAWKNSLTDLRTFLGINDPERGKPGARRPKKAKKRRQKLVLVDHAPSSTMPLSSQFVELCALREKLPPMKPAELPALIVLSELAPIVESSVSIWWKPWTWEIWKEFTA